MIHDMASEDSVKNYLEIPKSNAVLEAQMESAEKMNHNNDEKLYMTNNNEVQLNNILANKRKSHKVSSSVTWQLIHWLLSRHPCNLKYFKLYLKGNFFVCQIDLIQA